MASGARVRAGVARGQPTTRAVTGRNATALATGVQVRVVAAKDGMKVTALVVG